MRKAIDETERRRIKQEQYNIDHNITPTSIQKAVKDMINGAGLDRSSPGARRGARKGLLAGVAEEGERYEAMTPEVLSQHIKKLEKEMYNHAQNLEFEKAAALRDQISEIEARVFGIKSWS